MKTTLKLILILNFFWSSLLCAQQLPIYSFHRDHWGMANPAGVSSNYITQQLRLSVSATLRQQWIKVPDAPQTQLLSVEYIDDQQLNFSGGGHLINDRTGAFGQMGAYGNLAYRLRLGDRRNNTILAGGISFGGVQYRANFAEILAGSDQISALSFEDLTNLSNSNRFFFDVGLGLMLYVGGNNDQQNYYIGLSAPQSFGLNTTFRNTLGEFMVERQRHYYATAGGYFFADHSRNGRDPSFAEINLWARYLPNAPMSIDLMARYQYQKRIWAGIGGGTSKMIRAELGTQIGSINLLRIGVAYSQFISKLSTSFGQTLEASVSYSIDVR